MVISHWSLAKDKCPMTTDLFPILIHNRGENDNE